jgi:Recombinase zinc beta ribbon domain
VGTAPIGPRWTAETIRFILHNEIYWRGDENDMVKAYAGSKYEEPTLIPAYAPAYVSKAEAARVHARLLTNQRYASRNRKREWATLLHGGLVRCAQCGWALTPTEHPRVRKDGSRLTMYRCHQSILYGKRTCAGVTISAETLDAAVEALLTAELSNGEFLARFFAAWEADATLAMGSVREIETTIKETKGQIDNQVRRLATLAPGDALAAPVEANVRMLSETVAPLEERRDRAVAAAEKARGNDALREELSEWFSAWMFGFASLSLGRKREFLFSVGAKVLLHREGERDPRAQLLIALPTSASALPPAPWADGADGWELDLDLEEGATLAAIQREYHDFVTPARGMTAEEVAWYEERLIEAGFDTAAAKLRAMSIARSPFRRC